MQAVTTIGLDIAKSVFQVPGVDAAGPGAHPPPVEASRRPGVLPETASMSGSEFEACASSHYWSRELQALGHSVRLMPPAYVKPRRMTWLTQRPSVRLSPEPTCGFVPTKTPEQQSCLMLHRTRHLFIRQQTAVVINSIRAHLAEFGIVAQQRRDAWRQRHGGRDHHPERGHLGAWP